jgi:DNA-binding ferritin-like protein
MFEKLISTLLESRTQAHIFHWQTTGPGSYAAHIALQGYYDALPDMIDTLVETYQGKYGIVTGYTPAESFSEYDKSTVIKYFKALVVFVDRSYNKIPKKDTNLINQLDAFKDLIDQTVYRLENLQ